MMNGMTGHASTEVATANRSGYVRKNIALIEDEPDIAELISLHLEKAGYTATVFANGAGFLQFMEANTPDLVLLDLMLPDIDGLEICKNMRKRSELSAVPIIIVSAKNGEMDKVLGLELGADDYMTKPFSPKELVARVRALLRRQAPPVQQPERIEISGVLLLDLVRHELFVHGRRVDLTFTEFNILELLASNTGWVFSREKILNHLWGQNKDVIDRTVDVHIRHLRKKLGAEAHCIKNIRGVGYKLEEY
jgi:two-component system phosphate regulon response regulator PhoB/two-component system alkaline phosphatase synthesis response regulator PhoP